MVKQITTTEKELKIVDLEVDGRPIRFEVPKRSGLIMSVVEKVGLDARNLDTDSTRDLLNWLGEGMSEEDGEWILARLKDPEDDFDLEEVNKIAKAILGESTNRPTRRRRG